MTNSIDITVSLSRADRDLLYEILDAVKGKTAATHVEVSSPAAVDGASVAKAAAKMRTIEATQTPVELKQETVDEPEENNAPALSLFHIPGATATPVKQEEPAPKPEATEPETQKLATEKPSDAKEPKYTLAQIMKAGVDLLNAGKNPSELLEPFGLKQVSDLKESQYNDLAEALIKMGAKL
jgi:hypothetical protein